MTSLYFIIIIAIFFIVLFVRYCYQENKLNGKLFGGLFIVLTGMFVPNYSFNISSQSTNTNLSIDTLFLIMILGTLWNVVDIKKIIFETKQYRLQDFLIGILFGATLSFFLIILGGGKYLVIPENDTWQNLFLLIFQISVAEELLFRGFTLKYLQGFNLNPIFSNLIQSLTFTLLHTSRYTSNFIILSVVFLSGYIAGYFTIKNNNIFIAIVIHVTVNLVSGIYLTINFI